MKSVTAACFDVYYYNNHAKAGCIVFEKAERERILSSYSEIISGVQEYIPGQFYKRELPCLLAVMEKVNENVDFAAEFIKSLEGEYKLPKVLKEVDKLSRS